MSLDTWKQAHTSSIIKAEETVTFTPDMFGSGFTSNKAEAARTQILCDYLNSVEGVDPDISSLYSKLSEFQQDKPTNIIHRVNKGQERGYCSWDGREVCIPKITKEYAGGKATTITHELGHWLDNYFEKGKGWFTETNKALSEAISKCEIQESSAIPKEILDLSAELRKFDGTLRQEINDRYLAEKNKVIAEKGGYTWAKQSKRIWQKLLAERDSRLREWKPAYTSLEDIVDALSKGKATNTWHSVNYGHGLGYYARVGTTAEEIFANYCAINMTNPEVAKMLKKYFPELDEALRGVIRDMKKGMKKP